MNRPKLACLRLEIIADVLSHPHNESDWQMFFQCDDKRCFKTIKVECVACQVFASRAEARTITIDSIFSITLNMPGIRQGEIGNIPKITHISCHQP
jgi:hypothetical protein